MAVSTSKRVYIYRFDRQPLEGIVNPANCFLDAHVEVITPSGNLIGVLYGELKAMCFVSDNAQADLFDLHTHFTRRPKNSGLWARFTFRDASQIEGVLPHNLLEWPQHGYFMTPPHASLQRQRVFIPKLALAQTELRGVVGGSLATGGERRPEHTERQLPMFE